MKKVFLLLMIFTTVTLYGAKSIDIDLSKQRLYAKENGRIVFSGAISSGKSGHRTPTGTFRILEKDRFHISNKYPEPNGGAKMPYMHRLTRGGIAVHQGYLPGYPASHGCIRVSKATAKRLWNWSHIGMKVRVYGNAANFRYVKKRTVKKKHYSKHKVKRSVKKRKVIVKRVAKKRYVKKRVVSKRIVRKRVKRRYLAQKRVKRHYKRYTQNYRRGYEVIEIYDNW